MSDLTAVSLFAGIGGFDEALHRAGATVKAAVEIDPACHGILRRHFPETALFNDVTEVTGDQLRATGFVPGRGILTAGWPCQGNSVAGRRGGMADPRSGLWRHVVRLLAETRPRWFIGENVPGLLSINGGRDFGSVIRDLDELGYGVAWRVLDAQFFGVPQRRRRVFLVGCLGDPAGPVEVLLEPEGGYRDSEACDQARPGPASEARGGVVSALQGGGRRGHRIDAEGAAGGHLIAMPVAIPMAFNPQTGGSKARIGYGDMPTALQANQITAVAIPISQDALRGGEGIAKTPSRDAAGRMRLRDPGFNVGQDGDPAATIAAAGPGAVAVAFAENQRGELIESAVSHQLATGGGKPGQGFLADRQEALVRRLTPTECERLQGFPDGWTDEQADSARYRQLGNSVAVPCVEWITRRLVAADTALSETRGAA